MDELNASLSWDINNFLPSDAAFDEQDVESARRAPDLAGQRVRRRI